MTESKTKQAEPSIRSMLKAQALILIGFVGLFWLIEIVDFVIFGGSLDALGIRPRSVEGLLGIITMPFLHGGFGHLVSNTGAFLVLGWLIMLRETWHFFAVFAISMVVAGLGVWLIAPAASVHIGASGVVFGFFGFLLLAGWFERSISTIIISVIVALFYGGIIWGVFPREAGISWQGHLFGFIGCIIAAKLLSTRKQKQLEA